MKRPFLSVSFFAMLFFILFFASGCTRRSDIVLFDNSDPLALDPSVKWAVVSDPYAAYRKNALYEADVTGHCRKGDVLQVIGQQTVKDDDTDGIWYDFPLGWLPSTAVAVYSNKYMAETAAAAMESN